MKSLFTTIAVFAVLAAGLESARADDVTAAGCFGKKKCNSTSCDSCGSACGSPTCGAPGCGSSGYGSAYTVPAAPPVYPYGGGPWNGGCVWVQPCCPPFNGMLPPMNNNGPGINGGCPLPQHPYARSPRDYFMYYDRY
jgi:hypothetical protein